MRHPIQRLLVGLLVWLAFIALAQNWTMLDRALPRTFESSSLSEPDEILIDIINSHSTTTSSIETTTQSWSRQTHQSTSLMDGQERSNQPTRGTTNWKTDAIFQSKKDEATVDDFLAYNYKSPLNDKTLPWNSTGVRRDWMWFRDDELGSETSRHPPAMLLLTDAGWNHPDRYEGRRWIRSKLQRRLLMGVLQHRWFHPTAWKILRDNPSRINPNVRYYVFADMETCGDKNYPHYGFRKLNLDKLANRDITHNDLSHESEMKQSILSHPLFSQSTITTASNLTAKLIIFDCNGYIRHPSKESQWWNRWIPINNTDDTSLVVVSLSARHDQQLSGSADMGLPPPAIQPCVLTDAERKAILHEDCSTATTNDSEDRQRRQQSRPYFFTFSGNFRHPVRQQLQSLDGMTASSSSGGGTIWMATSEEMSKRTARQLTTNSTTADAFRYVASHSQFGAAPRGDNLFSFRFTELLSCGAIPVVYADDWVFPFRAELIKAESYTVVIPEENVNKSLSVLERVTPADQCRLRKRGLEVYEGYMKNGEGTIRGIIETLESVVGDRDSGDMTTELPGV